MEANLCKQEEDAAENNTEIDYLKREEQRPVDDAGQVLSIPDSNLACTEQIEEGFLYEIDHSRLHPKSPIQLKAIRAVMVTEKTELNVSVRFPSILSLRTYFSKDGSESEITGENSAGKMHPALDEQFIMGSNLAGKVLGRRISSPEFSMQKDLKSFWLVPTKVSEISTPSITEEPWGMCYSALKCDGLVHWAVRKRVSFIGRHREYPQLSCSAIKEEEEDEDDKEDVSAEVGKPKRKLRKRKLEKISRDSKKKSSSSSNNGNTLKSPKDRWSSERYKLAEEKILEIMKEKGAVFGNPMLRPALRLEARKYIGDTGLLDHLLKHMAGKVAPGGTERFRRRHNADGAMEYWLESADLVKIRKEAGVQDPYWTPPVGWNPGDSPSQDPTCARELKVLKEEMESLKRDVEELRAKRVEDEEGNLTPKSSSNTSMLESDTSAPVQEIYKELMKRKSQLEQQLIEISNSLKGMQEEMGRLTSRVSESGKSVVGSGEEAGKKGSENHKSEESSGDHGEEGEAAKRQRLRSGFRICKPQGTFLWPNMGGGSNMLSPHPNNPQVLLQVEDIRMVPTPPPSASSATSAPPLPVPAADHPLHQNSSSPVKPLAERRAVFVSISSVATPRDCRQESDTTTTLHYRHSHNVNFNYANGFSGTPTSSNTAYPHHHQHYQRRHLMSTTTTTTTTTTSTATIPRTSNAEDKEGSRSCEAVGSSTRITRATDMILYDAIQKQQKAGSSSSSFNGRGAWLALATPSPTLDDLNQC